MGHHCCSRLRHRRCSKSSVIAAAGQQAQGYCCWKRKPRSCCSCRQQHLAYCPAYCCWLPGACGYGSFGLQTIYIAARAWILSLLQVWCHHYCMIGRRHWSLLRSPMVVVAVVGNTYHPSDASDRRCCRRRWTASSLLMIAADHVAGRWLFRSPTSSSPLSIPVAYVLHISMNHASKWGCDYWLAASFLLRHLLHLIVFLFFSSCPPLTFFFFWYLALPSFFLNLTMIRLRGHLPILYATP